MPQQATASHRLLHAPTRKKPNSHAARQGVPAPSTCSGEAKRHPRRAASEETIARVLSLPERAPEGTAFLPFTLLHRRVVPFMASEAEVTKFNAKISKAVCDFGRRNGFEARVAWFPHTDPFRGLHGHGVLFVPHANARQAQVFMRAAIARHAGVERLPARALEFETRKGPVRAKQARGWLRYCSGQMVPQGQTVGGENGVKGRASLHRPLRGRRCSLPRFKPAAKLRPESGGTPDAACAAVTAPDDPHLDDADAGRSVRGLATRTSSAPRTISAPSKHDHPRAEGSSSTPRGHHAEHERDHREAPQGPTPHAVPLRRGVHLQDAHQRVGAHPHQQER